MLKLVVLSCVLAAASAVGVWGIAPYAYTAPLNNYRGPLSLAPGQPANVLGWDGRPLDTLDVNLDRSAHLVAKAYSGHLLKKRSVVSLVAPTVPVGFGAAHIAPYYSPYTSIAHISPYSRFASPLITHW